MGDPHTGPSPILGAAPAPRRVPVVLIPESHVPDLEPGRAQRRAAGRPLSLERQLPLFMIGALAALLLGTLVVTYGVLVQAAESATAERLAGAARQIAVSAEQAMEARMEAVRSAAHDPAVVALFALPSGAIGPEGAGTPPGAGGRSLTNRAARDAAARTEAVIGAARARLAEVQGGATGWPVVVLAADGTPLVAVGEGTPAPPPPGARPLDLTPGTIVNGPLHALGDSVYAWTVSAVDDGAGIVLGYVAAQMRVSGPAEAAHTVREMTGEPLSMYVRDAVSGVWVEHPWRATTPPTGRTTRRGLPVHERNARDDTFVAESGIAGTSWYAVVEAPVRLAHARAMEALRPLALGGAVLLLLGGLVAWRYSRRVTAPLAALTAAAEAISVGDYSQRVQVSPSPDELLRLAASFNAMAARIEQSGRELRQRAEEVQAAWAQAAAGDRAKGDFLAVMSHELRTPLNAIGGYAQLLEMELHGPVTPGQRQALQRIALNQKHLLALINDVLIYSRLGAGGLKFGLGSVDVASAFDEVRALVESQLHAGALKLERDEPVEPVAVRADEERLRQILLNLVGNAMKFTPPGGTLTLRCVVKQDHACLIVADTGIGIPPERLETIFEPFVQLDRALNRPAEGVGLGLSISRHLAVGMGGELRAENQSDGGAAFTLTLPRADTERGQQAVAEREQRAVAEREQQAVAGAVDTGVHA